MLALIMTIIIASKCCLYVLPCYVAYPSIACQLTEAFIVEERNLSMFIILVSCSLIHYFMMLEVAPLHCIRFCCNIYWD
jgi:hypothetical protein